MKFSNKQCEMKNKIGKETKYEIKYKIKKVRI